MSRTTEIEQPAAELLQYQAARRYVEGLNGLGVLLHILSDLASADRAAAEPPINCIPDVRPHRGLYTFWFSHGEYLHFSQRHLPTPPLFSQRGVKMRFWPHRSTTLNFEPPSIANGIRHLKVNSTLYSPP